MDTASRNIILEKSDYLFSRIDLNKLRPGLEKYEIFTKAMLQDIYDFPSEYDFYVELTTRGPDAFDKFRQVLRDAGYWEEDRIFENKSSKIRNPDTIDKLRPYSKETEYYERKKIFETKSSNIVKKLCYQMNKKPLLGYCLIINNVKFKHHTYREGSDVDAKALNHLFEKFGYEVDVKKNLEADEIVACLKEFSLRDWSAVDSCVVIMLSHGNNSQNLDVIYGSDSKFVKLLDIYSIFDNENCESLRFKPKMFFFSACRGDEVDFGVWTSVSSDAARVVIMPTVSNMLVIHSTLPNHESYRDHDKGTFFCQDLVEVFSNDYSTQDLETMLKTVSRKLKSRVSPKMSKQVLNTNNFGFDAHLYFCMENVADICEIYDPQKELSITYN